MLSIILLALGSHAFACSEHLTCQPTLREAAQHANRLVGSAVNVDALQSDPQYRAVLAREFNLVTAENVMKMKALQPKSGVFDFAKADILARFAEDNGMLIRGHTLVWHRSVPDWLTSGKSEILRNHIATVVKHFKTSFPGLVRYWDVVNEALGDDGKPRAESIWKEIGTSPTDYMKLAFQTAHEADPSALLFYNDYSMEELGPKSDAVYAMIRSLREQGVPIHGIGFQMHLWAGHSFDFESMAKNFERFSALGLEIHITELDVALDLRKTNAPTPELLSSQAELYRKVTKLCRDSPKCSALVTWGFTDKYSWIPHFRAGWGGACLFDEGFASKPGYQSILDGFSR